MKFCTMLVHTPYTKYCVITNFHTKSSTIIFTILHISDIQAINEANDGILVSISSTGYRSHVLYTMLCAYCVHVSARACVRAFVCMYVRVCMCVTKLILHGVMIL